MIIAGKGNNLIAAGLGQDKVQRGNGTNILIDGSVKLASSTDSLRQMASIWRSGNHLLGPTCTMVFPFGSPDFLRKCLLSFES